MTVSPLLIGAVLAACLVVLLAALVLAAASGQPYPSPDPIRPALDVDPHQRAWTEDERLWDLQLTGRTKPVPFDRTVD